MLAGIFSIPLFPIHELLLSPSNKKAAILLHRQYRRQDGQDILDLLSPSQARSLFLFFFLPPVAFSPMTTTSF